MIELSRVGRDEAHWELLSVFASKIRVEIVRFLLESNMATASDVRRKLIERGFLITPTGVIKHIKTLENAGIVRKVSGGLILKHEDARKKVYVLEGKERVSRILQQIEDIVCTQLLAGVIFYVVSTFAHKRYWGFELTEEEGKQFELLVKSCKDPRFADLLTEDERRNVNRWTKL